MTNWNAGYTARRWWQSMNESQAALQAHNIKPAGSSQRALLRRCTTIEAACMTEGFRALWQSIPDNENGRKKLSIEVCAAIAAVVCQVRVDEPGVSIGKACGRENEKGRVPVSEIRFARLQSARTLDELVSRLRRLLPLIKHSVDVAKLAMDINDWAWQKKQNRKLDPGRRIEMRWAMEYYSANDNQPTSQSGEA